MKLKTRLIVAFVLIIILPILLTTVIFFGYRIFASSNIKQNYGVNDINVELLSNPVDAYSQLTEEEMKQLENMAQTNPSALLEESFLDKTEEALSLKASNLVIIRDGKIVYNKGIDNDRLLATLEKENTNTDVEKSGYYLRDFKAVIRSFSFELSDGTYCELNIVTRVNSFISAQTLLSIFFAILAVLLITSIMLIWWIRNGVFYPVHELSEGMQHVADGNFDYALDSKGTGEIAELYENYNQMRMRLKESTEETIRQENESRELISNISHDLKTPITSIKGYVEGIMDGVADTPEKMDRYIKTIYNKTNDLNQLINELTVYSNIESRRVPYNFRKLNMIDYFTDCVEEVGLDLESKNIKLNYIHTISNDTVVIADPEQLKRVINNIIGNSVKYMDKPRGEIDIRLLDEVDSVRVEIEDNGRGVSPKELSMIFERFYRADSSRNTKQGGSGIGLSIVKKIIEDHGGYIWATSKVNEGTCMHFVLRKYEEADPSNVL